MGQRSRMKEARMRKRTSVDAVREGTTVDTVREGRQGGNGGMRYNGGAAADVDAGLVRHSGGSDSVGDDGRDCGVRDDGRSHGVRHDSRARDDVHAGLVGHGGRGGGQNGGSVGDKGSGVCEVSQGPLLQEMAVSGKSVSGVSPNRSGVSAVRSQDGSGVRGDDGRAGAHVHTRLVGDGSRGSNYGGSGDHSGGSDHRVSDGNRGNGTVQEGTVAFQGLSLQVDGAGVDHICGLQGAAVWIQDHGGVVRRLRPWDEGATSHGGESEEHHHRFHCERGRHIHSSPGMGQGGGMKKSGMRKRTSVDAVREGTTVDTVREGTTVDTVREGTTVDTVREGTTVDTVREGTTVDTVREGTTVDTVREGTTVDTVREGTTVDTVREGTTVDTVREGTTVDTVREGTTVDTVREGTTVDTVRERREGGNGSVRYNGGAAADVDAGLVRHSGGSDSVGDNGRDCGVRDDGRGHGVGHDGRARDDVHAGLVGHGGGSGGQNGGSVGDKGSGVCEVSQGALLQEMAVSGKSVSGVSPNRSGVSAVRGQDGSGVRGDDGRAGAHVHTGLVGDGSRGSNYGGSGDHSGGSDHRVSDGKRGNGTVQEGTVAFQGLSLQVDGAGVDHISGLQGAAVWVQDHGSVVRRLRPWDEGATSHGGESEEHHHRFHCERGLCFF
ncbi:hypothetical protein RR46_09345 [Papilio xuthus]|uniref:Uncharacterized protein n=1 Tax=Papilio xuthus TaxID=66420 RepID=A0A194PWP6_PAPXU|nr:hypothetical protein RR46_09345 [Papilio xuthus]